MWLTYVEEMLVGRLGSGFAGRRGGSGSENQGVGQEGVDFGAKSGERFVDCFPPVHLRFRFPLLKLVPFFCPEGLSPRQQRNHDETRILTRFYPWD